MLIGNLASLIFWGILFPQIRCYTLCVPSVNYATSEIKIKRMTQFEVLVLTYTALNGLRLRYLKSNISLYEHAGC